MAIATIASYSGSAVTMKWKEPFLTEGLNAHLASTVPEGIFKGFYLSTSVTALRVTIVADATTLDHVAQVRWSAGASSPEYAMKVRLVNGNFELDLTAFVNETVVVALYANYTLGSDTVAELRVYSLADYEAAAEKSYLVPLGTVKVPAAGVIAASSIWNDRRKTAWQAAPTQTISWKPIIRNGSFEYGDTIVGLDPPYWTNEIDRDDTAAPVGSISTTNPRTGGAHCFQILNSTAGLSGDLYHNGYYKFKPGQRIRIQAFFRKEMNISSGTVAIKIACRNTATNTNTVHSIDITAALSGATGSYIEIDRVAVISGSYDLIYAIGVSFTGTVFSGADATAAIRIDDFQAWLERTVGDEAVGEYGGSFVELHTMKLGLHHEDPAEPAAWFAIDEAAAATGAVVIKDKTGAEYTSPALSPQYFVLRSIDNEPYKVIFSAPSNAFNANIPRIAMIAADNAISDFTKLFEVVNTNTAYRTRFYQDYEGEAFYVTLNAKYDTTALQWIKDTNGVEAHALKITPHSIDILNQVSGTNTWAVWPTAPWSFDGQDKTLWASDTRYRVANATVASNPAVGSAVTTNTIYAKNMPKAWGKLRTGGSPVVDEGFGISTTINVNASRVLVTLLNAMSSNNYVVIPVANATGGANHYTFNVFNMTTTQFEIEVRNNAGTVVDPTGLTVPISFVVFGTQA